MVENKRVMVALAEVGMVGENLAMMTKSPLLDEEEKAAVRVTLVALAKLMANGATLVGADSSEEFVDNIRCKTRIGQAAFKRAVEADCE
jgi:hypothetical protein